MGLGSTFKRLLPASGTTSDFPEDAFDRASPTPQFGTAPRTIQDRAASAVLHRDEVIDAKTRIVGYRFHVRSPSGAPALRPGAVIDALKAEAVTTFAQRRMALIPLTVEEWHAADYRQFVAPKTVFVVAAPRPDEDLAGWSAGIEEIRRSGVRLAFQGADAGERFAGSLRKGDLALVNFRDFPLHAFDQLVQALRRQHPGAGLAVESVSSWPERRLCVARGAEYCLGEFVAQRDEEEPGQLNQSRLVLIEMLNLLRKDADLTALTAVAKRDPAVAVHILSMANSPAARAGRTVASLEQAMMVLGRAQLYRWISISMFRAGSSGNRDEALLEMALARARFLELIALASAAKHTADELFLVGLLSLLDCLLGLPMPAILAKLSLPAEVEEVLLRSQGPYARPLALAIAVERGHSEQWASLAQLLGIDPAQIQSATVAALAWAEEAISAPRAQG